MAKKRTHVRPRPKATIDVNHKSIQDILRMDLYSLNATDTRNLANRLVSASNKRLRYLERDKTGHGVSSPAYKMAMEKGVFSVRGKSRPQIMNEIKRMREFLNAKSSTTRGWNRIRKNIESKIAKSIGVSKKEIALSNEQYENVWSAYELMKEYRDLDTLKKIFGGSERAIAFAYEVEQKNFKTTDEKRRYIREVINRMEFAGTTDYQSVLSDILEEDKDGTTFDEDGEDSEEDFPW